MSIATKIKTSAGQFFGMGEKTEYARLKRAHDGLPEAIERQKSLGRQVAELRKSADAGVAAVDGIAIKFAIDNLTRTYEAAARHVTELRHTESRMVELCPDPELKAAWKETRQQQQRLGLLVADAERRVSSQRFVADGSRKNHAGQVSPPVRGSAKHMWRPDPDKDEIRRTDEIASRDERLLAELQAELDGLKAEQAAAHNRKVATREAMLHVEL